jgi:hypothetical protein
MGFSTTVERFLLIFYKIRDRLLPLNTKRRLFVRFIFNLLLSPKATIKKLNRTNFKQFIHNVNTGEIDFLEEKISRNLSTVVEKPNDEGNEHINKALQLSAAVRLKLFLSDFENKLTFKLSDNPIVSIIIITFNKAWHTYRCLEFLKAHVDLPHEVIIVDNSSKDETLELLNRLKGIKVIRNQYNYGFIVACREIPAFSK